MYCRSVFQKAEAKVSQILTKPQANQPYLSATIIVMETSKSMLTAAMNQMFTLMFISRSSRGHTRQARYQSRDDKQRKPQPGGRFRQRLHSHAHGEGHVLGEYF